MATEMGHPRARLFRAASGRPSLCCPAVLRIACVPGSNSSVAARMGNLHDWQSLHCCWRQKLPWGPFTSEIASCAPSNPITPPCICSASVQRTPPGRLVPLSQDLLQGPKVEHTRSLGFPGQRYVHFKPSMSITALPALGEATQCPHLWDPQGKP